MAGRADRIVSILQDRGGRLSVQDIHEELESLEGVNPHDLGAATVPATVRQDNDTRVKKGHAKRFRVYGDDEERGWISLVPSREASASVADVLAKPDEEIPRLVEEANSRVRRQLKEAIGRLSWKEFESNFLTQVLQGLGFDEVEITQPTRDGGRDGTCAYRRGLVNSEAIVSAKHWKNQKVGPAEVQRLRGIKGSADTAIIVTYSTFTDGAVAEAKRSQNQRSMVLIDGDLRIL